MDLQTGGKLRQRLSKPASAFGRYETWSSACPKFDWKRTSEYDPRRRLDHADGAGDFELSDGAGVWPVDGVPGSCHLSPARFPRGGAPRRAGGRARGP